MRTAADFQGGDSIEMPSYNIRHSIATKVAAKKTSKGYTLSEEYCSLCQMPLMTLQGKSSCKVCPAIKKWVDRKNEGSRQEQGGEDARDVIESPELAEEVREEAPVEYISEHEKSEVTEMNKTDSSDSDDTNAIRERARQIIINAKCNLALNPSEDDDSLMDSPKAKWDGDMEWVDDRLVRERAAQIIKQARKNIKEERGRAWCEDVHFEPMKNSHELYKLSSDVKENVRKMLSTKVTQAVSEEVMGLDEIAGKACFKLPEKNDAQPPENECKNNIQEDINRNVDGTEKSEKQPPPTPAAYVSLIAVAKPPPTPIAATKDIAKADDVAKPPPTPIACVSLVATKDIATADDVAKPAPTPIAYVSSGATKDIAKADDVAISPPMPDANISSIATKDIAKADDVAISPPVPDANISSIATYDIARTDDNFDVIVNAPAPSPDDTLAEIKSPVANVAVISEEQLEMLHYSDNAIIAEKKDIVMGETNSTGIISGIASKVDDAVADAIGIFKSLVSCNVDDLEVPFEDEMPAYQKQQLIHLQMLKRQQQQLLQQQMTATNVSLPVPSLTLENGGHPEGCDDGFLVCGDRSAQASPGGLAVCDYDDNPTELYLAVQRKDWESTSERAAAFPQEASTWVKRMEADGRLRWRLLPLHAAIIFRAPNSVVSALLSAYPQGVACKDDQGMLPLHLALRHGCDEDVLNILLMAYPHSIDIQDHKGRTPIVLAHKSTHADRDMYICALEKGLAYYNRPLIKYDNPRYREKVTYEVEETYHLGLLALNPEDGLTQTKHHESQPTQTFLPKHFEPTAHFEMGYAATPQVYAANGFQYVPAMMYTPQISVKPDEFLPSTMTPIEISEDAKASEALKDAMLRVEEAKAFINSRNTNRMISPTSQTSTQHLINGMTPNAQANPFMPQMNLSTQGHTTVSCFSRQGSLAPGAQANTSLPQLDTIAYTSGTQTSYAGPHRCAMTLASPQVLRSMGSLVDEPENEDKNNSHHAETISSMSPSRSASSPKMTGKHFFA